MSRKSPPPQELQPILHSIEEEVGILYDEHPQLADKDVEYVYQAFYDFFKVERTGREAPEPHSTSKLRERLIDNLFQRFLAIEAIGVPAPVVNSTFTYGGKPVPNVEAAYHICFNILRDSVAFWRREYGPRGYLNGVVQMAMGRDFPEDKYPL